MVGCVKRMWHSSPGSTGWIERFPQHELGLECENETDSQRESETGLLK